MARVRTNSDKIPKRVSIRSYQVGFGDCYLLSFHYNDNNGGSPNIRHILIDFGSSAKPLKAPTQKRVAEQITKDCGGKLTAIVATHRHSDHISGFATNSKKNAPGNIIKGLSPELIIQPWTENPNLDTDAKSESRSRSTSLKNFGEVGVVSGLRGMHALAQTVKEEIQRLGPSLSKSVSNQLSFLGETNLRNLSAVKNLIDMGKAGKAEYLRYGDRTSLEKLLPGVKVHVLGPPTPKQYPDVAKQRLKDSSEYWHVMGASSASMVGEAINPFPKAGTNSSLAPPLSTRWFISRIRAIHGAQRLGLVRALDDALNNTSLILLFEVGTKKLLFPGDAQIENWNYALKDSPDAKENQELLAGTDFYKVGHHGSLNATPKTLWNLFSKRSHNARMGRITSSVSTMAGKHGHTDSKTEVPRKTLVNALKDESEFHSTQSLLKNELCCLIEFDL